MTKSVINLSETVFSIPDHCSRFVNVVSGVYYPCFTFDQSGRLIFTPDATFIIEGYIYTDLSIEIVFKDNAVFPEPWNGNQKTFLELLNEFIDNNDDCIRAALLLIYPDFKPATIKKVFVPLPKKMISNTDVMKVIKAIEKQDDNSDLGIEATQSLFRCGVIRIPLLKRFDPIFHESSDMQLISGDSISIVYDGWMTRESVIKKSSVQKIT